MRILKNRAVQEGFRRLRRPGRIMLQNRLEYIHDGEFHVDQLYNALREYAEKEHKPQMAAALPFAREKHEGQYRRGERHLAYIYHPMMVAGHAISLGFREDSLAAAALLHDVCEDCGVEAEDLPVGRAARKAVKLLTRDPETGWTDEGKRLYYDALQQNRLAVLIKLLDRCNNISGMTEGFSREHALQYLKDTKRWIYPLFGPAGRLYPDKQFELFSIRYHMDSVLESIEDMAKGENA